MTTWLLLALGTVGVVEAGARLPFQVRLGALRKTASRVAATVSYAGSTRRKQAALTGRARRLFTGSVALFLLLAAALFPLLAAVALAEYAGGRGLALAVSFPGVIVCALVAVGYAALRRRAAKLLHGG